MNQPKRRESGAGLIVVILIIAFLVAIGIPLLVLTSAGSKTSGSFRLHDEAFNAAEAGFDAARRWIENQFSSSQWVNFSGHYLTQPTGIDIPLDASGNPNASYFRRKTDQQLLSSFDTNGDGTPEVANLIYFQQTFALDGQGNTDPRWAYTVFLLDDEAGTGTVDPTDALLVAIGVVRSGSRILDSVRLEIRVGL
jgi:type II secretory pathway pseudopilin PulG